MPYTYKAKILVEILPKDAKTYSYNRQVIVDIAPGIPSFNRIAPIEVSILPEQTPAQSKIINYPINVVARPVPINVSIPLINTAQQFISSALAEYIDEDRELKTLLNYGEDKQSVILAYRPGASSRSIQLKLLQPVPDDITINSSAFLSREIAKSIIDKVKTRFAPPIDRTPYLRPKNTKVNLNPNLGKKLKNVTLERLTLQSGSLGGNDQYTNVSFEDEIFRKWYSYDFNSAELNIDFTDYSNFVFYSSAALRLIAFREKLKRIEKLEVQRQQFVSSSFTASTISAGSIYVQEQSALVSKEIENITRGFDRYEQYLYFTPSGSNSSYSASFDYVDTGTEYNLLGYWPKSGSVLYPVTSSVAMDWFNTQYAIAQRYDEFNENNLVNTLPTHIREDEDSDAYITFVSMIGHFFDMIKPFIDQLPNINDRWLDPNEGLAKDLINEIAESYGFRLPTLNSVYSLSNEILGTESELPRREFTAQTYKRLLHNLPLFAKAKGTKNALNTLLRSFGITPEFLTIREVGAATTSSYKVYDEFSTGLDFDSGSASYVKIPFSASLRDVKAIQFNALLPVQKLNTLITGDDKWGLHASPHPTIDNYGRLVVVSGSAIVTVTDYYPIYTNDLINITLQKESGTTSVQLMSTEGDVMVFTSPKVTVPSLAALWSTTEYLYVGGSGSAILSNFEGTIDEFRMWGKNLSQKAIETNAYDPGSNAADDYSDATEHLFAQLSFNFVDNDLLTGSAPNYILNESPYANIATAPSMEQFEVYNVNTGSFSRYTRIVKQIAPVVGSQTYVTNKIKILPPPVFDVSNLTSDGVKKLSRKKSIVTPEQKRLQASRNEILVSISPTDFVNENIIRNLGAENINNILGLPSSIYQTGDLTLAKLQEYYSQYYYAPININQFIRILSGVSSVLDQMLNYFIPSKATLFKGIVIEPNILERTTVPLIKNTRVYGAGTRKTLNAASSLTGSKPDYAATFNLTQVIDLDEVREVKGDNSTQNAELDVVEDNIVLTGNNNSYKTDIDYLDTSTVVGKYDNYTGEMSHSIGEMIGKVDSYNAQISSSFTIETISSIVSSNGILKASPLSNPITLIEDNIITAKTGSLTTTLPVLLEVEAKPASVSASLEPKLELTSAVKSVASAISSSLYEINSSFMYYTSSLELNSSTEFSAQYVSYNTLQTDPIDVRLSGGNKIKYNDRNFGSDGAEPFKRAYSRKLFKNEIETARIGGTSSLYIPALREIKPIADLTDVGTRTYFNNSEGVYLFAKTEKLPVYPKPINFQAATTWSYGQTYNIYDVVYQDVSPFDENLGELAQTARGGNGRYYVFSTRPSYLAPSDGSSYYLGGVPSYLPPALDRDNWQVLKFKPLEIREPRRIVYDTFTIPIPELNNYKTTTVSIDKIVDIPTRYTDILTVPSSIPSASYTVGESTLQNTFVLFALQANTSNLRIRIYSTKQSRDADVNRSISTVPTGSHGVLVDTILPTTNVTTLTNPIPLMVAGELPPNGTIFYTINNLTSEEKSSVSIYAFYFALEIEPRIPFGYLPKHYRFYRDNSTATKRRNYDGCKNTEDTTIDGLPPVQVFISEGTDLVVSPTQTNTEIQTGGGGKLSVT